MLRVATEFENVPLGDAHVFDELPRGVWKSFHLLTAQLGPKPTNCFIEAGMSALKVEQVDQVLLQRLVFHRPKMVAVHIPAPSQTGDPNDNSRLVNALCCYQYARGG